MKDWDALEAAERRAGPITIPGLVWPDGMRDYAGWRPSSAAPTPADPREAWRISHASALRSEVLAAVDSQLVEEASAALAASQAAADRLRALEWEKVALQSDVTQAGVMSALTIDRRIDAARHELQQANERTERALAELRTALTTQFDLRVQPRERALAREQDEEAAELERQAGDRRLSLVTARGWLGSYLPEPAAEPAAAPVKKKRRGIFR